MRVAVTGAKGMLGADLVRVLKARGEEVIPLGHEDIEITSRDDTLRVIGEINPDVIVNTAAYTKVDQAETDRQEAYRVNGLGVQNLALSALETGAVLCHVSTDYVFSGDALKPYTPFDLPSPINFYGLSKLAGEQFVRDILSRFYIVRTSWLYGEGGKNFVKTILRLASERDELRVVNDQIGSPTWTVTLAEGIGKIIKSDAYGVHHLTDRTDGGISWYDFACEIIARKGLKTRVTPIETSEFPTPARRPKYSVLDTFFTEVSTGFSPPDWKESLSECLNRI
ncbi:MAG: dTDP-4-dehydrorhamnose reductase [Nitrospirae bacterium]|nr:MAG: dTDP-4-dehydrorhamnose reductase [Nitrospirota bacterium]